MYTCVLYGVKKCVIRVQLRESEHQTVPIWPSPLAKSVTLYGTPCYFGFHYFCCFAAICLNGAILLFCGANIVTFAVIAYNLHHFGTL